MWDCRFLSRSGFILICIESAEDADDTLQIIDNKPLMSCNCTSITIVRGNPKYYSMSGFPLRGKKLW